jgi:mycothiol synthase
MAEAAEPIQIGAPEERSELETTASLLTLADPDGVDANELQEELASLRDRPGKVLRLALARADGAVTGASCLRRYPSEPTGLFHVSVAVEPGARRRGVGTMLLDDALRAAGEAGATRVHAQALDAEPAATAFAVRQGFITIAHALLLRVDLSAAPRRPDLAQETALETQGIRVTTFAAERDAHHPETDHRLYEINRTASLDDPGNTSGSFPDFDRWRTIVLGASWFQPEAQFVAVSEGRYVGLAAAGHDDGDDTAEALIAGVEPAFRGRGIVQALKARTLAWAAGRGATGLVTQVDAGNAAMLRVSEKLGFEREGGVRTLERALGS